MHLKLYCTLGCNYFAPCGATVHVMGKQALIDPAEGNYIYLMEVIETCQHNNHDILYISHFLKIRS